MMPIIGKNVGYQLSREVWVFKNLSFILAKEKTGLVGRNGIGKTTLIRIINGELKPTEGSLESNLYIGYLPQDYKLNLEQKVVDALIPPASGQQSEAQRALNQLGLFNIDFERKVGTFSGGEKVKIMLAKVLMGNADFIILDEPTNNLDTQSREAVYDFIRKWSNGLLVVSHDRSLLNIMDQILEFTEKGLKIYGGDFDFYREQKQIEDEANQRQLTNAEKKFKTTKSQGQEAKVKQEKRSQWGQKNAEKVGLPKIILGARKRRAEVSTGKLLIVHERRIADAFKNMRKAKENILPENEIHVDLSETSISKGKLVCKIKDVSFDYPGKNIFNNLNLEIFGQERISINGSNGAGKTTLVKMITKELEPSGGTVNLGVERLAYLDQSINILNPEETILENLKRFSDDEEDKLRKWLAQFLFITDSIFKKAEGLSGGEKMRAALACVLAGHKPSQLLILDEPTNNLDLNSIEQIESALLNFQGTLIVISHDQEFLKNIGIEREINLGL